MPPVCLAMTNTNIHKERMAKTGMLIPESKKKNRLYIGNQNLFLRYY
jgi:hypothetical protein